MSILVYVESPYQLNNALSYLQSVSTEADRYIIRDNGSEKQQKQFLEILRNKTINNISFSSLPYSGIKKILLLPVTLAYLFAKSVNKKTIVIGDARSIVSKILIPCSRLLRKSIVLVDDGLYLLSYVENITQFNYSVFTNLPIEKFIDKHPHKLTIIKKDFHKIVPHGEERLIFIGMKLTEIGFMELDDYIKVLSRLSDEHSEKEKIYYSHRGEDCQKLDLIKKIGFTVFQGNLPLENLLLRDGCYQGIYYTFYSTALYNLSNMLTTSRFVAICPKLEYWPKQARKNIALCYKLFDFSNVELEYL